MALLFTRGLFLFTLRFCVFLFPLAVVLCIWLFWFFFNAFCGFVASSGMENTFFLNLSLNNYILKNIDKVISEKLWGCELLYILATTTCDERRYSTLGRDHRIIRIRLNHTLLCGLCEVIVFWLSNVLDRAHLTSRVNKSNCVKDNHPPGYCEQFLFYTMGWAKKKKKSGHIYIIDILYVSIICYNDAISSWMFINLMSYIYVQWCNVFFNAQSNKVQSWDTLTLNLERFTAV